MAAGMTAGWLTEELRVTGLVMLPTAIVAGLLVVYFEWRAKLLNPIRDERHFLQGLVSLAGAASIALLVPFAILMVGLPIALSIRGVLELFGWLFGVSVR